MQSDQCNAKCKEDKDINPVGFNLLFSQVIGCTGIGMLDCLGFTQFKS